MYVELVFFELHVKWSWPAFIPRVRWNGKGKLLENLLKVASVSSLIRTDICECSSGGSLPDLLLCTLHFFMYVYLTSLSIVCMYSTALG
jgi:hypothetical protein